MRLQVLIPAVDNAIAGNAYRPGDVIKTRKGLHIEIGNTDAEGRVILCDALAYGAEGKPDLMIDMATLTGAARIALGAAVAGAVLPPHGAGARTRRPRPGTARPAVAHAAVARLPRRPSRATSPTSSTPGATRMGGAINAANFLADFVPADIEWLHIDLFAWNDSARPGRPVGGEAQTVRTLLAYLETRFARALTQPGVNRLALYLDLIRWNRPAGWLLLLWPTLSALWIAADGFPGWHLLVVFVLGTVLMRSAGCCVNDVADRDFDRHVARTAQRPVTRGALRAREALAVGAVLALAAFALVLSTNAPTVALSFVALAITLVYPYAKRFVSMPQAVLGVAFSFGIPMAFAAVQGGNEMVARGACAPRCHGRPGRCWPATCSGSWPTTPSTRWSIATTT